MGFRCENIELVERNGHTVTQFKVRLVRLKRSGTPGRELQVIALTGEPMSHGLTDIGPSTKDQHRASAHSASRSDCTDVKVLAEPVRFRIALKS